MTKDEHFEMMVGEVAKQLANQPQAVRLDFLETPEHMLIRYHSGLGQDIRNEYGLWEHDWEPEIIDGVDVSVDHPDAISMRVICEVWKRANNERFKQ